MNASMTITVGFSWWVVPYLRTCAAFAMVTGLEPDVEKIARFACRYGLKVCR